MATSENGFEMAEINTSASAEAARRKMKIDIMYSRLSRKNMPRDCDAWKAAEEILTKCYDQLVFLDDKIDNAEI